MSYVVVKAGK